MPGLTEANQALRRGRVSASNVGALMPEGHPFHTKADLYAWVKHGLDSFSGSKQAVEMGHAMEDFVLRYGSRKTGVRVRANSRTRVHPTLPLAVTCDAYEWGSKNRIPVEIKTAAAWKLDEWQDGAYPSHYGDQVQAQLLVAGGDYGRLWGLIGGRDFREVIIPADPERQRMMAERIEAFFRDHVDPGIPPEDTPASLLVSFAVPVGTGAASGDLAIVGDMVADLMGSKDTVEDSLQTAREGLISEMLEAGLSLAVHPDWTAELKPTKSGRTSLRFTRKKN